MIRIRKSGKDLFYSMYDLEGSLVVVVFWVVNLTRLPLALVVRVVDQLGIPFACKLVRGEE